MKEHCRAHLFDAHAADEDLSCANLREIDLQDHQLLWVDLEAPDDEELAQVAEALELPSRFLDDVRSGATTPELYKCNDHYWMRVVAVSDHDGLALKGRVLTLALCRNRVLSVHAEPLEFLRALREREAEGSTIGALRAESFVAALLDRHLATYFAAAADFEAACERLEVAILDDSHRECLPELRRLRKAASRLRRMLAPHRHVYESLSRPDFQPHESGEADAHLAALHGRYERAMDVVENTRELVVGSFELFSSQVALRTNESMRVLSFIAVVTGTLAVLAGILGMNFDAPFFQTKAFGFWTAVASMAIVSVAAVLFARRWRWI